MKRVARMTKFLENRGFEQLQLSVRGDTGKLPETRTLRENIWIETSFTICVGRTS